MVIIVSDPMTRQPKEKRMYEMGDSLTGQYEDFVSYMTEVRRVSDSYINSVAPVVLRFIHWCAMRKQIESLSDITLDMFFDHIKELDGRRASIAQNQSKLFAFAKWMTVSRFMKNSDHERLMKAKIPVGGFRSRPKLPYSNVNLKKMIKEIDRRHPFHHEIVMKKRQGRPCNQRLLASSIMNVQLKALMNLILETGIRVSEAFSLSVSDVDIVNDAIRVVGKGHKYRFIPYTNACKIAMSDWIKIRELSEPVDNEALWIASHPYIGAAVSSHTFKGWSRNYGPEAEFHRLRRTFAVRSYRSGIDIKTLRDQMGHDDIKTTLWYLNEDEEISIRITRSVEGKRAKSYGDLFHQLRVVSDGDIA